MIALILTTVGMVKEILIITLIVSSGVAIFGLALLYRWGTFPGRRTRTAFAISALVTIVGAATAGVTGGAAYRGSANTAKEPSAVTTGTQATASFAKPMPDQTMTDLGIPVSGSVHDLGEGQGIWLTVRENSPTSTTTYQPQSKPCTILLENKFECPQAYAGARGYPEKKYDVILLTVTPSAADEFIQYDKSHPESRGWPGFPDLPNGATPIGTVQVVRPQG